MRKRRRIQCVFGNSQTPVYTSKSTGCTSLHNTYKDITCIYNNTLYVIHIYTNTYTPKNCTHPRACMIYSDQFIPRQGERGEIKQIFFIYQLSQLRTIWNMPLGSWDLMHSYLPLSTSPGSCSDRVGDCQGACRPPCGFLYYEHADVDDYKVLYLCRSIIFGYDCKY